MKKLTMLMILFASATAAAQGAQLKAPEPSPPATVSQTVGLTDITVKYHRPAVAGRKVWGGLVPYGEVWRAGANFNTTITFSTDVSIGGKPLRAGTYGLHMIPTQDQWTVIFSTMAAAWGSYSYDAKEDALRVSVSPVTGDAMEERLSYRFDDPTDKSVVLALRWEKVTVPVKIDIDTPAVVMASMRTELRDMPGFFPQPWAQAAGYWLRNGGNLDEALKFADKSIAMQPGFQNQFVKAAILDKKGNAAAATELRNKALAVASEQDLNQYGYQLVAQKKLDEAIAIFQRNVKAHPGSWNVHDSLAEAYQAKGDRAAAIASYTKALQLTKDPVQKTRIEKTIALLKK